MVEAIGLQLHLFNKQLPFAAQPPGGVLGQEGQLGGRIGQAAAEAHHQAIERGLNQGLGRRHGGPARQGKRLLKLWQIRAGYRGSRPTALAARGRWGLVASQAGRARWGGPGRAPGQGPAQAEPGPHPG